MCPREADGRYTGAECTRPTAVTGHPPSTGPVPLRLAPGVALESFGELAVSLPASHGAFGEVDTPSEVGQPGGTRGDVDDRRDQLTRAGELVRPSASHPR